MHPSLLPQGDQAALAPGAAYSVPGLFLYSDLIYTCLDQVEAKFGYRIPVRYLYGSPKVLWNGGRLVLADHHYTSRQLFDELAGAAARGITPLLTFSMTRMTPEDLADPAGNELLEMADQVKGGVIVVHPLLRDYIRQHYPRVEVHASVVLTSFEKNRDLAYYEGLARDYDRYVVHPDDNFRPDLLARLPKDRGEIILNERCVFHCPQRKEHYLSTTDDQRVLLEGEGELSCFLDRCPFVPDYKQCRTKERNISLTTQDLVNLQQMGFSLFKLQGRLDIPYVFFFDFLRYTLENQVAFPAMYPSFAFAIRNHLKEKERRRRAQQTPR